jgi:hypothetical protein
MESNNRELDQDVNGEERDVVTPLPPMGEGDEESEPLATALGDVRRFLRRYVAFPSPSMSVAISLWVAHTYQFDVFETSPILALTSAEMRSGKTRCLDVIELLVKNPWRSVMPTEAVVFRKIHRDHPTMLLDEVDAIFSAKAGGKHEGLRALLNAGNRRGTTVPRMVGEGSKLEVVDFTVFSPKVIAGIGKLPNTVADRAISIPLRRRAKNEPVEPFRLRDVTPQARPIREAIADAMGGVYLMEANPSIPPELDDRSADGWEPLLAIADAAGGLWPALGRTAAVALSGQKDVDDDSLGELVLLDVRALFDAGGAGYLHTKEILDSLRAIEERTWSSLGNGRGLLAHDLARLLKPYGIRSRTVRVEGSALKGYARADFEDAWSRYLANRSADMGN